MDTGANPKVEYFKLDGADGRFFRCNPYRATLSTVACAKRWNEAETLTGQAAEKFEKCRGCSIGAMHAGHTVVHYSPLYMSGICPRCGRGTSRRLIGGTRCISCYNREIEVRRGRNSKGTRPTTKLARRAIRISIDNGPVRIIASDLSLDTEELMLAALRQTRGHIRFAFHGRSPLLRQGRLI